MNYWKTPYLLSFRVFQAEKAKGAAAKKAKSSVKKKWFPILCLYSKWSMILSSFTRRQWWLSAFVVARSSDVTRRIYEAEIILPNGFTEVALSLRRSCLRCSLTYCMQKFSIESTRGEGFASVFSTHSTRRYPCVRIPLIMGRYSWCIMNDSDLSTCRY